MIYVELFYNTKLARPIIMVGRFITQGFITQRKEICQYKLFQIMKTNYFFFQTKFTLFSEMLQHDKKSLNNLCSFKNFSNYDAVRIPPV